jgi:hypothetical protein
VRSICAEQPRQSCNQGNGPDPPTYGLPEIRFSRGGFDGYPAKPPQPHSGTPGRIPQRTLIPGGRLVNNQAPILLSRPEIVVEFADPIPAIGP